MSKFDKTQFNYFGGYLTYGAARQFVARFKHKGPFSKSVFLKELLKNHTVESYFAAREAGAAPLQILKDANPTWWENTVDSYFERR